MWTLPAPIVTAENAWAAYCETPPMSILTTAQRVATRHYLKWKESNAEQTSTDSRNGASLTSTNFAKGDTVKMTLTGKIDSIYGDHVDVEYETSGRKEVACVSPRDITLVKKVAPPEPAVGAIIDYYGDKWLNTTEGWKYVPNSGKVNPGKGLTWNVFEHDRVKAMSVSPYFLITR